MPGAMTSPLESAKLTLPLRSNGAKKIVRSIPKVAAHLNFALIRRRIRVGRVQRPWRCGVDDKALK